MSFFNINPWSTGGGGGGNTPIDPANLPKVYEYYQVASTTTQELWEINHPNFDPNKDKLLLYINSVFVTPSSWELVGNASDGYKARIPIETESEITTPPTLDILILTNTMA